MVTLSFSSVTPKVYNGFALFLKCVTEEEEEETKEDSNDDKGGSCDGASQITKKLLFKEQEIKIST